MSLFRQTDKDKLKELKQKYENAVTIRKFDSVNERCVIKKTDNKDLYQFENLKTKMFDYRTFTRNSHSFVDAYKIYPTVNLGPLLHFIHLIKRQKN